MQEGQKLVNQSFKMEEVEGKTPAELLTLGMKAFWTTNYKHAVQYLGKSSELLVEQHKDDKHDSLAEVYLFYGKTLLELSREEGDPLGEAVPKEVGMEKDDDSGDDDDDEVEEKDDKTEKKKTQSGEKSKTDDEKARGDETSGSVESIGNSSEDKQKGGNKSDDAKAIDKTEITINGEDASSNSTKENDATEEMEEEEDNDDADDNDDAEDAGEGTSDEKAEEEEPTDLQLAWQVLELARLILERRGDSAKAEYADCLITLGEVSLENEAFDSAITDINSGLKIQQQLYKDDASKQRRLAETCYKLGLAHSTNNQIEDGVKCYEQCLELLKKRITAIEKSETEVDKKERADIAALMPEIEEKITDLKNYKEEAAKSLEAAKEPATVASPEKRATDISHLVKRKRKLEEPTTSEVQPAKKPTP